MKIRTDFVTNSSSSSFVSISIENEKLAEILKQYRLNLNIWGKTVSTSGWVNLTDEAYIGTSVKDTSNALEWIVRFLEVGEIAGFESIETAAIDEIMKNKDEVISSFESFELKEVRSVTDDYCGTGYTKYSMGKDGNISEIYCEPDDFREQKEQKNFRSACEYAYCDKAEEMVKKLYSGEYDKKALDRLDKIAQKEKEEVLKHVVSAKGRNYTDCHIAVGDLRIDEPNWNGPRNYAGRMYFKDALPYMQVLVYDKLNAVLERSLSKKCHYLIIEEPNKKNYIKRFFDESQTELNKAYKKRWQTFLEKCEMYPGLELIWEDDFISLLNLKNYNSDDFGLSRAQEEEKEQNRIREEEKKAEKEKANCLLVPILDELRSRYANSEKKERRINNLLKQNTDIENIDMVASLIETVFEEKPEEFLIREGLLIDENTYIKNRLFEKLDARFSDKTIISLRQDEEGLAKKVSDNEGYASVEDLLEAYGYTFEEKKTIEEINTEFIQTLKERYPNGSEFSVLVDLIKLNPDLGEYFSMLQSRQHGLYGMTLLQYLVSIGILKEKEEKVFEYTEGQRSSFDKRKMDLFTKLDEAYPDKVISQLYKNHKEWAETALDLARMAGFDNYRDFLEDNGYTVDAKTGRPSNDYNAIIEELKRRYPDGPVYSKVNDLRDANPDLASKFQSLLNRSNELFGMSFKRYLIEMGILKNTHANDSKAIIEELKRRYPDGPVYSKVNDLRDANPDFASEFETLSRKSNELFGKTFKKYLIEMGILKE